MNIPVITKGATTDHGGTVVECFETFTIDGKKVHLDGMKHFCPKCNKEVFAIASNHTKTMMGKAWVLEGDKASCGARFISNQGMGFVGGGNLNSTSSSTSYSLLSQDTSIKHTASQKFHLIDEISQINLVDFPYEIYKNGELVIRDFTDNSGFTQTVYGLINDEIELYLLDKENANEFCCKP